jgi:hypothetical protein
VADIAFPFLIGTSASVMVYLLSLQNWNWATFWSAVEGTGSMLAFGVAVWLAAIALRQIRATDGQLAIAADQLKVMRDELHHGRVARKQDNKPTVVLDRRDHPERGSGNFDFVLCNVGRGLAANVYEVNPARQGWRSLGGLAAGAERPVPPWLYEELNNPGDEKRFQHIIIAEGIRSRTRRWNPTLNLFLTDSTFIHLFTYPHGDKDSLSISAKESQQDLVAYLEDNSARLAAFFATMPSCGGKR